MTGKTTLSHALVTALGDRGCPAVRHSGMLAEHHPLEPMLARLPLIRQPESWLVTTDYLLGGYALGGLLADADRRARLAG